MRTDEKAGASSEIHREENFTKKISHLQFSLNFKYVARTKSYEMLYLHVCCVFHFNLATLINCTCMQATIRSVRLLLCCCCCLLDGCVGKEAELGADADISRDRQTEQQYSTVDRESNNRERSRRRRRRMESVQFPRRFLLAVRPSRFPLPPSLRLFLYSTTLLWYIPHVLTL